MERKKPTKGLAKKVWDMLEEVPETRDSDYELTRRIWKRYCPDKLDVSKNGKTYLDLDRLEDVYTQEQIKRERAYIQNDLEEFPPTTWEVAKQRKWKENAWRIARGYSPVVVPLKPNYKAPAPSKYKGEAWIKPEPRRWD